MYTHHKFDHEFAGDARMQIAYAVCATPRCGSSLLCEHLCNSGIAGAPTEFFDRESYDRFREVWGATGFAEYTQQLLRRKTGPNGVFGFKVHWDQYVDFLHDVDWRELWPDLRCVFLTRRDRLGQAISFSRAVQTGQWAHDHTVRNAEPRFDYDQIMAFLRKIEWEEKQWNRFFAANRLEPVRVVYEDLVAAPQRVVTDVLTALGIKLPADFRLPAPTLRRQADRLSWWWRQRVRARRVLRGPRQHLGGEAAAKAYGVEYLEHDIPTRLPAGAVHHARVTVRNDGNFVWRSTPTAKDGGIQRGEVALVLRLDGEWVDTKKLPEVEVAPGEQVTIAFPLRAPTDVGDHVLGIDLIEWEVTQFRDVGIAALTVLWSIEAADPGSREVGGARFYGVRYVEHNIPGRLPAGKVHGARVTLQNDGNFVWRSSPARIDGIVQRGEVALIIRLDGQWIDTRRLPVSEVAPGEQVTVHFPLTTATDAGDHVLTLELIEWDVARFEELGVAPLIVSWASDEADQRTSARLFLEGARVNPWRFEPTRGVLHAGGGGLYPLFASRSKGCRVWDLEGREYIDYTMGHGTALLGHAEPRVQAAIREVMEQTGPSVQLTHPLEIEVSRMLTEDFPCAEMVTFGKNGSDACTVVARLARAFTGRSHILYRGYHGWQDFWAEQPGLADTAIPPRGERLLHVFQHNDRDDFFRLFEPRKHEIAAVMIEPSSWGGDQIGFGLDDPEFLATVAEATRAAGALLVFDETMTSFRYRQGSAQEATGVVPDLACVGKAIANGMPLAAAVGRADVMQRAMTQIFYPGPSFRGEIYSLAAAKAAMQIYRAEPVADRVWDHGRRLAQGIEDLCRRFGIAAACKGPPFRTALIFDEPDLDRFRLKRTFYMQELLREGVLTYNGIMLPSHAHDDATLEQMLTRVGNVLSRMADAEAKGDLARHIEIPPVFF